MEGFASEFEPQKVREESSDVTVTEIGFKFIKKVCVITVRVNENPPQNFKINYKDASFQVVLERPLKALGIGLIDYTSIHNLYHIKIVENLLYQILKVGMKSIYLFTSISIYELTENKTIPELIKIANIQASSIMKQIDDKFEKIYNIVSQAIYECYERMQFIKNARDELIDNLNKRHVLVVNQLIKLAKGEKVFESQRALEIRAMIENL